MSTSVSAIAAHAGTFAIVTSRRHLPTWMTSGMLAPAGTSALELPSVKLPAVSVLVSTIGMPDRFVAQVSQLGPSVYGVSAVFGI